MKRILTLFLFLSPWHAALGEAPDKNTYSNPTLGITVTKPQDWQFATAEQHSENLGRTKMKDEEFQALVQKYSTAPIVVMMKHPEPFPDLNPSLKINVKPLGDLTGDDPKALLELIVPSLRKAFHDFEMVETPKEIKLAGHRAAYMKIHYNLAVSDGQQFATCSEMWVVPRGNNFFLIGSGTRQDEKTGKRSDIQKILSSLRID
jgi:hypothetical protein